jgi:hypothetical protein
MPEVEWCLGGWVPVPAGVHVYQRAGVGASKLQDADAISGTETTKWVDAPALGLDADTGWDAEALKNGEGMKNEQTRSRDQLEERER